MKNSITVRPESGYLVVELDGPYHLEFLRKAILVVRDESSRFNCNRILLDLTAINANPTDLDRILMGRRAAAVWGSGLRVAAIAKAHLINRVAERVAVGRGTMVRAHSDRTEALTWLLEQEPEQKTGTLPSKSATSP